MRRFARLKHDDSVDGVILFSGTWVWASEIVAAVRDFERAGKGVIIWTKAGPQDGDRRNPSIRGIF